ncbi:hypothetical protein HK405_014448 [Cladochytrium tenue]|nr:hypothetical protein HK405_014448 [Cladochytrium tenue]
MPLADLDTTVVLISGKNSGIGFDTAVRLATDTNQKSWKRARSTRDTRPSLTSRLAHPLLLPASLSRSHRCDQGFLHLGRRCHHKNDFVRLNILINNAGIAKTTSDGLQADLSDTFAYNTISPGLATEAFVPLLKTSSDPRII